MIFSQAFFKFNSISKYQKTKSKLDVLNDLLQILDNFLGCIVFILKYIRVYSCIYFFTGKNSYVFQNKNYTT